MCSVEDVAFRGLLGCRIYGKIRNEHLVQLKKWAGTAEVDTTFLIRRPAATSARILVLLVWLDPINAWFSHVPQ